jgi:hypothetical protein
VSGTDSTYSSGVFGLLVADQSSGGIGSASALFDNLKVTAVPEPAHLGLLGGLLWMAGSFFRRNRKA